MKPVDKKDLPKLYVLVAFAVCILGYFVYAMTFGAETPPASAAGKKKDATKNGVPRTVVAANTPGGVPPGGAGASDHPVFDPTVYGPPQGGRDPFQPVGPVAAAPTVAKPIANNATPPVVVPPIFTPPPARQEPPHPPSSLGQLLGNAGQTQDPGVQPVKMESAPAPSMAVTGVVLGDPSSGNPRNVAILRGNGGNGSEDRRFVSVGDYIGNGYTVVAVHADGIEIQDKAGNRRVTIKLGQPGDNARAN